MQRCCTGVACQLNCRAVQARPHAHCLPTPVPSPPLQLSLDVLALPGGAGALRLWSAEEPNLYLLLLSLVAGGGSGEVLEIEACQVGAGRVLSLSVGRPAGPAVNMLRCMPCSAPFPQ